MEGTSSVTAENLTVLDSATVGPAGECSVVAQLNNNLQEFCGGFSYDDDPDAGSEDSFWDDLISDCNENWFMECLDSDHKEEPSQDNSSSELKRKFESTEEDLYQSSKKVSVDNPN